MVCVSWKQKEKWNHSSGGSGGSNWKIVNQALALACSCLSCMLAHLWLLLLLLFFVVVIVRIRTKRSRWNWSKRSTLVRVYFFVLFYWIAESIAIVVSLCCSGLMFYFRIEILCLPWNFRSRREFLIFLNLLHRNVRFVLIFHPFCFSFGGFLSLSLSLKVPLLVCVCEIWIRSPNTTVFFVLFHKRNNFVKWFFRVWFFLFLVFLEKNIHQNFGLSITDSV